jgi:hypothetical protein
MVMKNVNNNFWLVCLFIFFAALTRLLPHPSNVTAIGAMALFGGVYFSNRFAAFLVPLAAMLLSDIAIEVMFRNGLTVEQGFHFTQPFVYVSFILSVLMGFWIQNKPSVGRVIAGGLGSTTLFFLVTNFGVWMEGFYGHTFQGLINCYVAAIPFHRNTLMGDVVYITAMFGSFELIKAKLPALAFSK